MVTVIEWLNEWIQYMFYYLSQKARKHAPYLGSSTQWLQCIKFSHLVQLDQNNKAYQFLQLLTCVGTIHFKWANGKGAIMI